MFSSLDEKQNQNLNKESKKAVFNILYEHRIFAPDLNEKIEINDYRKEKYGV